MLPFTGLGGSGTTDLNDKNCNLSQFASMVSLTGSMEKRTIKLLDFYNSSE